jgi:hypothetical protein
MTTHSPDPSERETPPFPMRLPRKPPPPPPPRREQHPGPAGAPNEPASERSPGVVPVPVDDPDAPDANPIDPRVFFLDIDPDEE